MCVCVGGWVGGGGDEGRGVAKPGAQAAAGGKVWRASQPCPSAKTRGNFPSPPLTLFLRRNKVNLLRYSIPLAVQFFLLRY